MERERKSERRLERAGDRRRTGMWRRLTPEWQAWRCGFEWPSLSFEEEAEEGLALFIWHPNSSLGRIGSPRAPTRSKA